MSVGVETRTSDMPHFHRKREHPAEARGARRPNLEHRGRAASG